MPGKGFFFFADSLLRICEIQFSTLTDSELWAKLQTEEELKAILNGKVEFSGKLDKVQMPDAKTVLY